MIIKKSISFSMNRENTFGGSISKKIYKLHL